MSEKIADALTYVGWVLDAKILLATEAVVWNSDEFSLSWYPASSLGSLQLLA
jgi:hypothetical protein